MNTETRYYFDSMKNGLWKLKGESDDIDLTNGILSVPDELRHIWQPGVKIEGKDFQLQYEMRSEGRNDVWHKVEKVVYDNMPKGGRFERRIIAIPVAPVEENKNVMGKVDNVKERFNDIANGREEGDKPIDEKEVSYNAGFVEASKIWGKVIDEEREMSERLAEMLEQHVHGNNDNGKPSIMEITALLTEYNNHLNKQHGK